MYNVLKILYGWLYWYFLRIFFKISYKTVVLVLSNENYKIDECSVQYLDLFMKRKFADKALIIWKDDESRKIIDRYNLTDNIKNIQLSDQKINLLYNFYAFDKFFDNIVFTYTSLPEENLLGRVLNETEIDEKDAVCLALYHLRYVPE